MSLKQYSTPLLRCLRLWLLAALLPGYARLEASQGDNNSNETEIPDEFDPLSVKGQGPLAILAYPQGQGPKNQAELKDRYHALMRMFHTDRNTPALSNEAWQKQTEQAQAIVEANAMVLAMLKDQDKAAAQKEPDWMDHWITKWLKEKTSAMQMDLSRFFFNPFQVDTAGDTCLWQLYIKEQYVELASVLSQMARLDDGSPYAYMVKKSKGEKDFSHIRFQLLQSICFPQLVNMPRDSWWSLWGKYAKAFCDDPSWLPGHPLPSELLSQRSSGSALLPSASYSLLYAALSDKNKLVLYALLKNPALDCHRTNGGQSPFAWLIDYVTNRAVSAAKPAKRKEKENHTPPPTLSTSRVIAIIPPKPEDEDEYTDAEVRFLFTRVFLPAVPSSSDMKLFNQAKKEGQSLWDFYNIDKNIVWYGQRRQWAGRGLQIALLAIPFLLAYGVYRLYATKKRQEKEATPYVSPLEKEQPWWREVLQKPSEESWLLKLFYTGLDAFIGTNIIIYSVMVPWLMLVVMLTWPCPPALFRALCYWAIGVAMVIALQYIRHRGLLLWRTGMSKYPGRVAEAEHRANIYSRYVWYFLALSALLYSLAPLYSLVSMKGLDCKRWSHRKVAICVWPVSLPLLALSVYKIRQAIYLHIEQALAEKRFAVLLILWEKEKKLLLQWKAEGWPAEEVAAIIKETEEQVEAQGDIQELKQRLEANR